MRSSIPRILLFLFFGTQFAPAQQRTILAIGAHAADMELTAKSSLTTFSSLLDQQTTQQASKA